MKFRDYYEILEVKKDADVKGIRKSFRNLAKKYHPDHNPNNPEAERKFKEVSEAYEVLSDKEKRSKYDQFGHDFEGRSGSDFKPDAYGFTGDSFHSTEGDYSDFFNMFFGDERFRGMDGTSNRASRTMKGQNIEATISVNLEEAYQGTKKMFTLQGQENKKITVTIPKGIISGDKIRLKGKGEPSQYGKDSGDLILNIQLVSNGVMFIKGLNITSEMILMPWEAWYGGEKSIRTLAGNVIVTVPKNIKNGQKVRLKDKGYRNRKGQMGHHYVKFIIENPKKMSAEMEKSYSKLRTIST